MQCPREGLPFGTRHAAILKSHATITDIPALEHFNQSMTVINASQTTITQHQSFSSPSNHSHHYGNNSERHSVVSDVGMCSFGERRSNTAREKLRVWYGVLGHSQKERGMVS